jgi:NAD(P)-dependent dehydrogenase (short-subunit alcohol dehydrogenase family)
MTTAAIVFTGAQTGHGLAALTEIATQTDAPIIVGAYNPVWLRARVPASVRVLPLDLEDLESVRGFARRVVALGPIGTLLLNANDARHRLAETKDRFDSTFQVNYLAHFLLFYQVREALIPNARIVTTASAAHNPEERLFLPAPLHAFATRLARPDQDPKHSNTGMFAAARAYAASKLCCILFSREVAKRFPEVETYSFDPGFLPDGPFLGHYRGPLAKMIKRVLPMILPREVINDAQSAAKAYTDIILNGFKGGHSGDFISLRNGTAIKVAPSVTAMDPTAAQNLWEDSLRLLSLETMHTALPSPGTRSKTLPRVRRPARAFAYG